jgi:hypothetical protein
MSPVTITLVAAVVGFLAIFSNSLLVAGTLLPRSVVMCSQLWIPQLLLFESFLHSSVVLLMVRCWMSLLRSVFCRLSWKQICELTLTLKYSVRTPLTPFVVLFRVQFRRSDVDLRFSRTKGGHARLD